MSSTSIDFPPFRLDLRAEQLTRDGTPVALRPKTYAVLRYLAERPGALVTKRELLDAVWGGAAVSEDVVRLSAGEVRAALGDDRTAPRFLETVSGRGYRFIARTGDDGARAFARMGDDGARTFARMVEPASDDAFEGDGVVVGRVRERSEIAEWLRAAQSGRRQIGFVTGEAGIGKTTLVDIALRDLTFHRLRWPRRDETAGRSHPTRGSGARLAVARGQCIEQYGAGEPYLPVSTALAALCRGRDGPRVEAILRDHAPAWLLRTMGAVAPGQVERTDSAPPSHEHTLQRLAASLDALAATAPLVLVLEDMQWGDASTVDLLSVIAQRREPARLLVICTLRPAEAIARGHPITTVKRELVRKRLGREILLGGLSAVEVESYLAARFPAARLPDELLPLLVDRSEGIPFFLVALVDHLIDEQMLVDGEDGWQLRGGAAALRTAIPDGLRAVIEPRLERLTANQLRVLEAASVAGPEFPAHAVAAAAPAGSDLGDIELVEEVCHLLARRQDILRVAGDSTWPDGTTSARYAFRHVFYQQVIYQRLAPSTRRRLHQTIGERLEAAHGDTAEQIAGELAAHFERSGDIERAVKYHAEAAAQARSHFAYQEARLHLEAARALLRTRPESAERWRQEMPLLDALGGTLFVLHGYGSDDAVQVFLRLRELAERLDAAPMRWRAMDGLILARTVRAELTAAHALAQERLALAEQHGDVATAAKTRLTIGLILFHFGDAEAARRHAAAVHTLVVQDSPALPPAIGISSCTLLATTSAHLGRVNEARAMNSEALRRATEMGVPYFRAYATHLAAQTCALLRDVHAARTLAEETATLAAEYGLTVFGLSSTVVRTWCDIRDGGDPGGLAVMRAAASEYAASGQGATFFSTLLADAMIACGQVGSASELVDDALAVGARTEQWWYEHELHRLRGDCALANASRRSRVEAARHFERAVAIAAARGARLFELRAATSLCRVQKSARERLARLVGCFDADDDCADLRAAHALLGGNGTSTRTRT
ncbi:AAA family ATPase [Candidatus Binatia bacterium]|nr:AAA family ATPase [Candidatus Binatia bacterium]